MSAKAGNEEGTALETIPEDAPRTKRKVKPFGSGSSGHVTVPQSVAEVGDEVLVVKMKTEDKKEWLISTDGGYEWKGHEIRLSPSLQELLEREEAKEHQQDDGSYILSYIDNDLYFEIREELEKV